MILVMKGLEGHEKALKLMKEHWSRKVVRKKRAQTVNKHKRTRALSDCLGFVIPGDEHRGQPVDIQL